MVILQDLATFHKVAVCSILIYMWIQSLNMAPKSVKISGWNMQSDLLNIKYIDKHQTGTYHMLYDITILCLLIKLVNVPQFTYFSLLLLAPSPQRFQFTSRL